MLQEFKELDLELGKLVAKKINAKKWSDDKIATFMLSFGSRTCALGLSYIKESKKVDGLLKIITEEIKSIYDNVNQKLIQDLILKSTKRRK